MTSYVERKPLSVAGEAGPASVSEIVSGIAPEIPGGSESGAETGSESENGYVIGTEEENEEDTEDNALGNSSYLKKSKHLYIVCLLAVNFYFSLSTDFVV